MDNKRSGRALRSLGQGVPEFALASTFAFLLMFAVVDFGRAIYDYDLVSDASRIGSRYAIVHGSACTVTGCPASAASIKAYVLTKVTGLTPGLLIVNTTWTTAAGCPGAPYQAPLCVVTVQVQYPFKFVLSFNRTVVMTSTSQMVISQ